MINVPKFWFHLYMDRNKWKPVTKLGAYGVEKDKFIKVVFKSIKTLGLRMEVQLQSNFSA